VREERTSDSTKVVYMDVSWPFFLHACRQDVRKKKNMGKPVWRIEEKAIVTAPITFPPGVAAAHTGPPRCSPIP
jgi:hypothetical protein